MGDDDFLPGFDYDAARSQVLQLWAELPQNENLVRPACSVDAALLDAAKGCFVQGWTADAQWWNFGLVYGGVWIGDNLNRLPSIRDFLVCLPYRSDIVLAGVSILKGGAAIPRHHDEPPENRGSFRVEHFGLFGQGVLHVNASQYTMGPGVHLTFDDANDHAATNLSSTAPRGVLYIKRRVHTT